MNDTTLVKQVMTPNPQWLAPDAKASEAMEIMLKGRFRHLPVCDNGRVVGIVSMRDLPQSSTGFAAMLRKPFRPATA